MEANPIGNTMNDWRLSFSLLQIKIALTLNDTQRICQMGLKESAAMVSLRNKN